MTNRVLKDNTGQEYNIAIRKKWLYPRVGYVDYNMLLELMELNINMKFVVRLIRSMDSNNIIQYSVSELAKKANVSTITAKRTIKILKDKFYIRRYSKRLYQINPLLIFKSNGKRKEVAHMMFINGIKL